jgi:hypothetical protein
MPGFLQTIWHYEPEEHTFNTLSVPPLCERQNFPSIPRHSQDCSPVQINLYVSKTVHGNMKDSELCDSKHFLNLIFKLWLQNWGLENLMDTLDNLPNILSYILLTQDFQYICGDTWVTR